MTMKIIRVKVQFIEYEDRFYGDDARYPTLVQAKNENQNIMCHCQGKYLPGIPLSARLYKRKIKNFVVLCVFPNSSDLHHADCPFMLRYKNIHQSYQGAVTVEGDDEVLATTLFDVTLCREQDNILSNVVDRRSFIRQHRMKPLGVLHYVWDRCGLNIMHPDWMQTRDYAEVREKILKLATHTRLYDMKLSDFVSMPSIDMREGFRDVVSQAINRTQTGFSIVIGQVARIDTAIYDYQIQLVNCGYNAPIFVDQNKLHQLNRSFFRGSLKLPYEPGKNHQTWLLASVLLSPKGHIKIYRCALMNTSSHLIPYDSLHELEVADALTNQNRHFIKPLRYDRIEGIFPDFILLDTRRPYYMEVFGMDNEDYLKRVQEKLHWYRRMLVDLWVWYVTKQKDMPSFPPIYNPISP